MSGEKAPDVFLAEDSAFLIPPPSYEEVMGAYNTSVKIPLGDQPSAPTAQSEVPPLAYIDIMPRCLSQGNIKGKVLPKFDNFSATMEAANQWLRDNPGLVAWKCETTENKLDVDHLGNLTYDLNSMLRHDATFGFLVYIRGLRLWLTKNPSPGSPPQQLGIMNIVPEKVEIKIPYRGRRGMLMQMSEDGMIVGMAGGMYRSWTTFEGLKDTLVKINKRLEAEPLPGTILSIETANIKAYETFKDTLDPEATCWSEEKMKFRRETQVVRIYYIKGPSAKEEIAMEEFVPEFTDMGTNLTPPKFQPFDSLIQRIAHWFPKNQGVRVVNIQQYDSKVERSMFSGEVKIASDSTDENVSTFSERRMCKTLRVFYVKSPTLSAPMAPTYVTSRVFLPARTGSRAVESMTKTMDRIDVWLRVTGLPILSVETVKFLFHESRPDGADISHSNYVIPSVSGKRWLSGIRVYFPSVYQEPDPAMLPAPPSFTAGNSSGACTIL